MRFVVATVVPSRHATRWGKSSHMVSVGWRRMVCWSWTLRYNLYVRERVWPEWRLPCRESSVHMVVSSFCFCSRRMDSYKEAGSSSHCCNLRRIQKTRNGVAICIATALTFSFIVLVLLVGWLVGCLLLACCWFCCEMLSNSLVIASRTTWYDKMLAHIRFSSRAAM